MKWIKFSEKYPEIDQAIMFLENNCISIALYNSDKKLRPQGYCCNDPSCSWISDDCGCDLIVNDDCYWLPVPDFQKEIL